MRQVCPCEFEPLTAFNLSCSRERRTLLCGWFCAGTVGGISLSTISNDIYLLNVVQIKTGGFHSIGWP